MASVHSILLSLHFLGQDQRCALTPFSCLQKMNEKEKNAVTGRYFRVSVRALERQYWPSKFVPFLSL